MRFGFLETHAHPQAAPLPTLTIQDDY